MKVVWKYDINLIGRTFIKMPESSKIISVGVQDKNKPKIWVELIESKVLIERSFIVIPTGVKFEDGFEYVGTVNVPDSRGIFVGHIYEYNPPATTTWL